MLFYLLDCVIIELIKSGKEIHQAIILKFIYVANPILCRIDKLFCNNSQSWNHFLFYLIKMDKKIITR